MAKARVLDGLSGLVIERYYRAGEVGKLMSLDRGTVRRYVREGQFGDRCLMGPEGVRIPESGIKHFIAGRRVAVAERVATNA